MLTATAILHTEHNNMLETLRAVDEAAGRLERGERVPPEQLAEWISFFQQFGALRHCRKEEELLFPLLEKKGLVQDSAPVAMMRAEHEQARLLSRLLEELAGDYAQGVPGAGRRWAQTARVFAGLLRSQIGAEDKALLLRAENSLDDAEQHELASAFAQLEPDRGETAPRSGCTCLWIG